MPPAENDDDVGRWEGDDLAGTARQGNGVGVEADLPDKLRFKRNVGALLHKRSLLTDAGGAVGSMAVFLFRSRPPDGVEAQREPFLGEGHVETFGQIWFCNISVQSAWRIDARQSASETYRLVEDIGCGADPAAVYIAHPSTSKLRYYPDGLSHMDRFEDIKLRRRKLTAKQVEAILDQMWRTCLITPDAQVDSSSIWADANKHWASSKSELTVQAHAKTALAVTLIDCNVRHEQPMARGRVDLAIDQIVSERPRLIAPRLALEIKVLRERNSKGSKKSTGAVDKWIGHGIKQAAAYRDELGADASMLYCLDMRKNDLEDNFCPATKLKSAKALKVVMLRHFAYNSAAALRTAEYGPD